MGLRYLIHNPTRREGSVIRFVFGLFVILHGLVHIWYISLNEAWVEFEPNMGWTGESWVFTRLFGVDATHVLATWLYGLTTAVYIIAGLAVWIGVPWWQQAVFAAAGLSTLVIALFWDGKLKLIVPKGLVGILINAAIVAAVLLFAGF